MSHIIDVTTLPNLNDLYQNGTLQPSREPSPALANISLNKRVSIYQGDICVLKADAIVNAANSSLLGGGGIDGAIHSAAGPKLLEASSRLNGCETGDAKITPGFNLPAKHVIHAVGPNMNRPGMNLAKGSPLLQSCYQKSMELAVQNGCKNIVFCCISTAIYRFPLAEASDIAISTVRKFLESEKSGDLSVIFCLFSDRDVTQYKKVLPKWFPPGS